MTCFSISGIDTQALEIKDVFSYCVILYLPGSLDATVSNHWNVRRIGRD